MVYMVWKEFIWNGLKKNVLNNDAQLIFVPNNDDKPVFNPNNDAWL
jgi:hypothetical protein